MSPQVRRRRRTRPLRHVRRSVRGRRSVVAILVLGIAGVMGVAWALWTAYAVNQSLAEVERQGEILRASLERGDLAGARNALERFQASAQDADVRTSGRTWWVAERIPIAGANAEAVRVVSESLAGIGRDGLTPLVDAADSVTARTFHPEDHVFPLERVAELEEPARRSEEAFDVAARRLAAVDVDALHGRVRFRFEDLSNLVFEARSVLGSAYRAAELMPSLLGADEPRRHLLVMQNNAELRSSGGLPGSLSVISADGGRVEIVEQRDMAELEGTADPVLPLTEEEVGLFGEVLGTVGVDHTLTPDFERAAALIRARWELQVGDTIDGIFFVDPVAVSYLLRSTGPIDVPGYDPVTAGNVVAMVENEIYRMSPRPSVHSDYQNAVAKAVFNAFASGRGEPAAVIRALAEAVAEGRIRMHSFDDRDQAVIAGTMIAGELPTESGEIPEVGLYLNEGSETKMSYYLDYRTTFAVRTCVGGVQDLQGSLRLASETPANVLELPPTVLGFAKPGRRIEDGQQIVVAYLMSPVGGRILEIDLGRGRQEPAVHQFGGREVATIQLMLDPGESRTVEFRVRSGRGQTGAPRLFVTPGARPGTQSQEVRSAC